jgi:hypothetical protein
MAAEEKDKKKKRKKFMTLSDLEKEELERMERREEALFRSLHGGPHEFSSMIPKEIILIGVMGLAYTGFMSLTYPYGYTYDDFPLFFFLSTTNLFPSTIQDKDKSKNKQSIEMLARMISAAALIWFCCEMPKPFGEFGRALAWGLICRQKWNDGDPLYSTVLAGIASLSSLLQAIELNSIAFMTESYGFTLPGLLSPSIEAPIVLLAGTAVSFATCYALQIAVEKIAINWLESRNAEEKQDVIMPGRGHALGGKNIKEGRSKSALDAMANRAVDIDADAVEC